MILLAISLACGPATLGVGDTGDPSNNNGGGDDSGDTGDTDDTQEPETNPHEGEYDGEMGLFVAEWDWELCEGEIAIEVDKEGQLEGTLLCVEESNWGDWEVPGELEGEVDEDGEVSGTVVMTMETRDGVEEIEAELYGEIDDGVELGWTAEVHWGGGGGGGGGSQELEGWAELD